MHAIPFQDFDCLLFDLDGTLADSMDAHNQAWITTLQSFDCSVTPEVLKEYAGIPNEKTIEIFNARFNWHLDPVTVARAKEESFLLNVDQLHPIEPVLKVALNYYQKKPMAIVSGGSRKLVNQILAALNIEDLFPIRVCAEDSARGKPFPDPFLLAASILKISPNKCIVFEDGNAGIQGAKIAGMTVVQVSQTFEMTLLV